MDIPSTHDRGDRRFLAYIVLVILSFFAAWLFHLRTAGLFACPASGYTAGHYLAYCNSTAYGDYDHGAFWFASEPDALKAAARADVLFLGNSRSQFGFSTDATRAWFSSAAADFYLLGFSHFENVMFIGPLFDAVAPTADAYVINLDGFFDDRLSPPATEVLRGGDSENRYARKRLWQAPHRALCGAVPVVCGNELAFFRDRLTGTWELSGTDGLGPLAVADVDAAPGAVDAEVRRRAEAFLAGIPAESGCVLFTIVPSSATQRRAAGVLAAQLDIPLIAPSVSDLMTFDGSHLDPRSAAEWSSAFFDAAGPAIRRCLANEGGA